MNVSELIAKLQMCKPDAEVYVRNPDEDWREHPISFISDEEEPGRLVIG